MSDLYFFTYYYNNGDSYEGYGFSASNEYYSNEYWYSYNETGGYGYYYIDSVYSGYSDSLTGQVHVYGYYDSETGQYLNSVDAYTTYGLGYENGYVYGTNGSSDYFGYGYYEADLSSAGTQLYYFTYVYGNGDSYSGYGYDDAGTYYAGEYWYTYNETGNYGYYYINGVYEGYGSAGYDGYVDVYSYYDSESGQYLSSVYGESWGGLGSEVGYGYNASYTSYDYFGYGYYEADVAAQNGNDSLVYVQIGYGNGDVIYGYAYVDNYEGVYAGYSETWYDSLNETGHYSSLYVSAVYDLGYDVGATVGNPAYATPYGYYDGETGIYTSSVYNASYGDVVAGYADLNGDGVYSSNEYFSDNYYEADV